MADVETEGQIQRRVEELIAISLYRARADKLKDCVRTLFRIYEPHLKPIDEVRKILAEEISSDKTMSQEVFELRRREIH